MSSGGTDGDSDATPRDRRGPGLMTLGAGCAAAAAGAAGAAGAAAGIAYTERGAETYVDDDVHRVAAASIEALDAMGIAVSERSHEQDETEIEIEGTDGDRKIVVDIEGNRDAGRTHIEVTASKDVVDYSQSRAEEVLRAILARL